MEITPYYDPMLAKLVTYAENRQESIAKMIWALSRYVVMGVTTNIPFLKTVLKHNKFKKGNITTHFIDNYFKDWTVANNTSRVDVNLITKIIYKKNGEIINLKAKKF